MDYVLFGMGYGASLMLLGWALRTFGPRLKYSEPPREDDAEFQVEQRFWLRFIQGLGGAIAIAGTTMVLMTFIVVLVNPDDDTGGIVALAIWAFIVIALVLWCWMYVKHYGLTGVWSRNAGYGFRGSSRLPGSRQAIDRPALRGVQPKRRLNRYEDTPPAAPGPVEADREPVDLEPVEEPAAAESEEPQLAADEAAPEVGDDPVYDFGEVGDTTVPSDARGRSEALRRLRERQARARQS